MGWSMIMVTQYHLKAFFYLFYHQSFKLCLILTRCRSMIFSGPDLDPWKYPDPNTNPGPFVMKFSIHFMMIFNKKWLPFPFSILIFNSIQRNFKTGSGSGSGSKQKQCNRNPDLHIVFTWVLSRNQYDCNLVSATSQTRYALPPPALVSC